MGARPPENPGLEAAMNDVAEADTPQGRTALYRALLESTLLVPTARSLGKAGWRTLDEETDVELTLGRNDSGEPTLPAFTGEGALAQWLPRKSAYIGLPGREVFRIATQLKVASVSINPAGPIGGELLPGELRALAEGQIPTETGSMMETITVGKLGPVRFVAPRAPPAEEFLGRIRDRAGSYPEIRRAYLFCADLDGGKEKENWIVGVEFGRFMEPRQARDVFRDLGAAIGPMMGTNETVDLMDLKAMGVLKEISELVPPIFERQAGGRSA